MTVVVGYTPNRYGQVALAAAISEAKNRQLPLVVVNATQGAALVDPRFATDSQIDALTAELSALGIE